MPNFSHTPFGYEISRLNSTIKTATDSKFNLRNKTLIKSIIRLIGLPHFGARVRAFYLNSLLNDLTPNSRILDAGCGIGLNAFMVARKNFITTGIDSDKSKINAAKQMLSDLPYSNIQFETANLLHLKPYKSKFDCVICFEVLEHIENDKQALREISQSIKKYGTLILSVPGTGLISAINQHSKHHVREGYELEELIHKLNEVNLVVKKVIGVEHTPLGLFLRYVNDEIHRKSLFATTILFFIFFPLALLDGLLPRIIKPQNWIVTAHKN